MVNLSLTCVIVGRKTGAFDVNIEDGMKISALKQAIKNQSDGLITDPWLKLQLFLAKTEYGAWMDGATAEGVALDDRGHPQGYEKMDPSLWIKNDKYFGPGFQPYEGQVHVLVVVPGQSEDASLSQIFPTFRPYCEGLNLQHPHLSRDALVEKLHEAVIRTNFVLLSSPSGSGKTSLLTLYARKHSEISCIDVTFDSTTKGATALLSNYGVNVRTKKCDIPKGKLCVLMLDDCQRVYNDDDFWTRLIKGSASWIPDHVRFIISATHLLETDVPHSPVTFGSIEFKLTRDNFLVKDEEAHQCLNLKNGLPPKLRFLHAGRGDDTRVQWAHRFIAHIN
ncbi:hypothetical protein Pcac1_g28030 [Phytophthora cactorum]|uniref:Crinkler effector protein N-terminal domain-containing protein n=1 Tax=Phytophthora cactorum TaxID=29920 RepID=A0A329S9F3_9STRA|nr:hypothetical protein Pcac1_g28030 [Phytophthora cactorum]KAG2825248.1 hypothetical protein PC111_g9477 [Phytophthora cactorum]KAG2826077.1 hypothetical protein PC112_g9436 [Phytophthora cactorum]KAG2856836.1 hypothetical protein PC113_g11220 [Phytophthora cactorum]KAG2908608.1 hypothetical protein PC114_g10390 [Phytophthora cactorum]